jgi:lipoate-protein ligase A
MEELRYIPPIEAPAEKQMAIDETLLKMYDEGKTSPTLRFYRFKPSAVSLGYSQDVDEVLHKNKCDELGINCVRRITGGGTVYHDYDGEITYSIITEKMKGEIEESFLRLLQPIIDVLKDFELNATFKPYNDILVDSRKISGSAQKRGKKGLLQHGTIMYATDLETLSDILILDKKKIREKGAESFQDLVTTMDDELGWKPDPYELIDELKEKYLLHFDTEINVKKLSNDERSLIERLEEKYKSENWFFNRKWDDR